MIKIPERGRWYIYIATVFFALPHPAPMRRTAVHPRLHQAPVWCVITFTEGSISIFPCLFRTGTALAKDPSVVRICQPRKNSNVHGDRTLKRRSLIKAFTLTAS